MTCAAMVIDTREGHSGESVRCELPFDHLGHHLVADRTTGQVWLGDAGGVHWPGPCSESVASRRPRPWWRFW